MKKVILSVLFVSFVCANTVAAYNIVNIKVNGKTYQAKEGYFLVKYKAGIRSKSINQIHAMASADVQQRFAYPEGLELVKVRPGVNSTSSLKMYQSNDDIEYIEPDYIWRANELPNDPMFSNQWALRNAGQTGGTRNADINILPAWDLTTGNRDVVVGIIDTGIDYLHPDLASSAWVNPGEIPGNGIDDDGNGFIDDVHGINAITRTGNPMDDNIHGTHVAGIIAASRNNGVGISGVAPNVSVAGCKFLDASGSGDTSSAITCLNYFYDLSTRSKQPVQIVATNNSWGGGPFSKALFDAIKTHQNVGILFIAAASNDGQNNDAVETYPANYYLSNVVSVAATDHNDRLASFSNYGRFSVSVAAPGVNIMSTLPKGRYGYLSGTSMAAPAVSGLAALISSYNSTLPWYTIKNLIIAGGENIAAAQGKTLSGKRILAFGQNGLGSLTCDNQTVVTRTLPRQSKVTIRVGQPLSLGIMSIKCENPSPSVRLSMFSNRASATGLILKDDGQGTDQVANDRVYSGTWSSSNTGTYLLRFPGNDVVTINVVR